MRKDNLSEDIVENYMTALAVFAAVKRGDVRAYGRALKQAERLVPDRTMQLAMVDSILDARERAYGAS